MNRFSKALKATEAVSAPTAAVVEDAQPTPQTLPLPKRYMTIVMNLDCLELQAPFAESEIGVFVMENCHFSMTESIWRGIESGGLLTEMLAKMQSLRMRVSGSRSLTYCIDMAVMANRLTRPVVDRWIPARHRAQ